MVRALAAAALPGLAMLTAFGSAQAVQNDSTPPPWLGIRLEQGYECVWETTESWKACHLVLHVVEVQDGGPAGRGGLEPGDRMIAINGQAVTFSTWDGLRRSIRAGTPMSIDVMRDDTRHFVRITPAVRTRDSESGRWVARRAVVERAPSVFVVKLTEFDEAEGGAFAITVRNTPDQTLVVEPAALRVFDGQLRLEPLSEELFLELPNLRRELAGSLSGISDSSYEQAISAVRAMANIRARIPSDEEFRQRLTRIAQVGLERIRLATRFRRSFAGAEFEEARRRLASAVDSDREGLLVLRVISGTPAARLGLLPGDILFEADGNRVRTVRDLARAVEAGGSSVEVRWERRGTVMSDRFGR